MLKMFYKVKCEICVLFGRKSGICEILAEWKVCWDLKWKLSSRSRIAVTLYAYRSLSRMNYVMRSRYGC